MQLQMRMSVERGISLKRAQELTGVDSPSAYEIRESFDKMTDKEKVIVIRNIKHELKKWRSEKKILIEKRKEVIKTDKPIWTKKIKEINKVIQSKLDRLMDFGERV